jgi:hypothetical protein
MHTRNLNTLHSLFHSFSNSRNNTTRNQRNRRSQLLNHKERNRKIKVPKPLQIVFKSSSRVATRQRCHLDTREEPELRKENCAAARSSTHRNTIWHHFLDHRRKLQITHSESQIDGLTKAVRAKQAHCSRKTRVTDICKRTKKFNWEETWDCGVEDVQ